MNKLFLKEFKYIDKNLLETKLSRDVSNIGLCSEYIQWNQSGLISIEYLHIKEFFGREVEFYFTEKGKSVLSFDAL